MNGVMRFWLLRQKIEQLQKKLSLFHINKGQEIKIQQVQLRPKT
jgi:hypothetical protein